MKKVLIILIVISAIACKKESKVDYAIISGTISNVLDANAISINALDRSFSKSLKLSDEGKFIDTLKANVKDYVLYDGKNPVFLYVTPGNEITINYDAKDFENSLVIDGEGAEISKYLKGKRAIETKHLSGKNSKFYTLDEVAFKDLFDKIADEQINLLETTASIPEDYQVKEIKNINYFYLSLLKDYENAHRYFTGNKSFKVSNGFLTELETIDYNNGDDYEFSLYYKKLVSNYFNKKASKIAAEQQLSSGGLALIEALKEVSNPKLKNGVLFDYANTNLTKERDIKKFYNAYLENSTSEDHKAKITKIYKKLNVTNPGEPSPKFINYENNEGGTMSLDDLKGKYVYIDVWATWCTPCIKEIPALKKIEDEFHGKNIEFVSISIDKKKDYEKWKKMIVDKDLKGIQLIADNEWKSSFVQEFSIKGIPRFILLDPEGNIVNANAPRPSDPALTTLINSLKI